MATITRCDICKRELGEDEIYSEIIITLVPSHNEERKWEVCHICMRRVFAMLNPITRIKKKG
jgi:uncharacterized protein with PIN domain